MKKLGILGVILSVFALIVFISGKVYMDTHTSEMWASAFGEQSLGFTIANWSVILSIPVFVAGIVITLIGFLKSNK